VTAPRGAHLLFPLPPLPFEGHCLRLHLWRDSCFCLSAKKQEAKHLPASAFGPNIYIVVRSSSYRSVMLPSSRCPLLAYPSLSVMLNIPGATRELSTAMIVNATGDPLLVPKPAMVTVCATSS
jgi:hypothetical protein